MSATCWSGKTRSDDIARGAKPVEVEGLVKPVAARLMHLALPGQILLSGVAHALARARRPNWTASTICVWSEHGRYRFKGVPDPVPVFEVGERGIAPLRRAGSNAKAHREVPCWRRRTALIVEAAVLLVRSSRRLYFSLRSPDAIAFAQARLGRRRRPDQPDRRNDLQRLAADRVPHRAGAVALRQRPVRSEGARHAQLMQRDPDNTKIDRDVGTEVAIRDGARALILPTRRRNRRTRARHGRSHRSAQQDDRVFRIGRRRGLQLGAAVAGQGQPATCACASAKRWRRCRTTTCRCRRRRRPISTRCAPMRWRCRPSPTHHDADALVLFRHAVKLDPNFALAYIGIARIYAGADDDARRSNTCKKAVALRDRLPQRDQLYLDAWSARFGPPRDMLEKWKLLGAPVSGLLRGELQLRVLLLATGEPRGRRHPGHRAGAESIRSAARHRLLHARATCWRRTTASTKRTKTSRPRNRSTITKARSTRPCSWRSAVSPKAAPCSTAEAVRHRHRATSSISANASPWMSTSATGIAPTRSRASSCRRRPRSVRCTHALSMRWR